MQTLLKQNNLESIVDFLSADVLIENRNCATEEYVKLHVMLRQKSDKYQYI